MNFHAFKDEANELAGWCSHTFSKNFVILEQAHRRIAGGCTDNADAWDASIVGTGLTGTNEFDSNGGYELRCSEQDATLFLLKYKESK